jgi:hypothetical protein
MHACMREVADLSNPACPPGPICSYPAPQTIATACLHLAAKVGESPKPIREVVRECERIIHQKHPEHLALINDPVRQNGRS